MKKAENMGPADLSAFDDLAAVQNEGIDVDIKGPDGKTPLGFSIKVAGPDSDRQKAAIRELQDKRLAEEDAAPFKAEDGERNTLIIFAKSTISWTPVKIDGAELSHSEDNAVKLFTRYPFILEQVVKKAGGRTAFLKRLSEASAPTSEEDTQAAE